MDGLNPTARGTTFAPFVDPLKCVGWPCCRTARGFGLCAASLDDYDEPDKSEVRGVQSFCANTCACDSELTPAECNDAAGGEYLSAIPARYAGIFNAACGSEPTTPCCDGYDLDRSELTERRPQRRLNSKLNCGVTTSDTARSKTTRPTFFMHGIGASASSGSDLQRGLQGDPVWVNLPIREDMDSFIDLEMNDSPISCAGDWRQGNCVPVFAAIIEFGAIAPIAASIVDFEKAALMAIKCAQCFLGNKATVHNQATAIKQKILETKKEYPREKWADGINLVCHSQGALICRYLVSTWDILNSGDFDEMGMPVVTFVSLAGPQMGVNSYGDFLQQVNKFLEEVKDMSVSGFPVGKLIYYLLSGLADKKLSVVNKILNTDAAQDRLSVAGYWHDRTDEESETRFRKFNRALALMNNEAQSDFCYEKYEIISWCCPPRFSRCNSDDCDSAECRSGVCNWNGAWDYKHCEHAGDESGFNASPAYQRSFQKLKHAVFLGSPQDDAIVPWQSTLFGYYAAGSNSESNSPAIEEWDQTYIHKHGLIPLADMMRSKQLELHEVANVLHNDWIDEDNEERVGGLDLAERYYASYL